VITCRACPLRGRARLSFSAIAACALAVLLTPPSSIAQQDERSVRAAFVYNLTKYVVWPSSTQKLNICVLGNGTIGPALQAVIDGKSTGQRTINVQLEPGDSELGRCGILYFSGLPPARLSAILEKTLTISALTVGEDESFLRHGGMIAFVRSGDSLQVMVNLDAVLAENLKISSRLLDLAIILHTGRRESR